MTRSQEAESTETRADLKGSVQGQKQAGSGMGERGS